MRYDRAAVPNVEQLHTLNAARYIYGNTQTESEQYGKHRQEGQAALNETRKRSTFLHQQQQCTKVALHKSPTEANKITKRAMRQRRHDEQRAYRAANNMRMCHLRFESVPLANIKNQGPKAEDAGNGTNSAQTQVNPPRQHSKQIRQSTEQPAHKKTYSPRHAPGRPAAPNTMTKLYFKMG